MLLPHEIIIGNMLKELENDEPDLLKALIGTYPDPSILKAAFQHANDVERLGIIRLWITEGIPYSFKDRCIRNIHAKEITLVGSARIGYSLKGVKWGQQFSNRSDLDFTIISEHLYSALVRDFQNWVNDFRSKRIVPLSSHQLQNWLHSIETTDRNIEKGYIYSKNLFPNRKYPAVSRCYYALSQVKPILNDVDLISNKADVSLRFYANWDSCLRQNNINLKSALELWS